jgi:ATP-binding cassette subfamily C protein CydD
MSVATSATMTDVATRSPDGTDAAATLLTGAELLGRRQLRRAAASTVLETAFAIGQWAALALVAEQVLTRSQSGVGIGLLALLLCGAAAAFARRSATRAAAGGREAIATGVRRRIVAAVLPTTRRGGDPEPAVAAHALLELADDVADYHGAVAPLRIAAPVSMVLIFAVTAIVHWPAAIVLAVSSALIPLNMRLAGMVAKDGVDRNLMATQRLTAMVLDSFRGLHTLKNLGAVRARGKSIEIASGQLAGTTMSVLRRVFLSGLIMDVVVTFSIAVNATYIGLTLLGYVTVPGIPRLTLFGGLFVLLLCPMYFAPMLALAAAFHDRERAASASRVLVDLLAEPERPGPTAATAGSAIAVRLDAVRYRAPGGGREILRIPLLRIREGEWTVVTGASGAGKTTLLSLVAGFRAPSSGTVEWSDSTALLGPPVIGGAAWIGQQTVILEGSVAENVRLGRADATDADVARAIEAAGLSEVVARLSAGVDTQLGEGGWGLSTGEARRVAIARALLSGARLWLLDEPTAHLDPQTEREVLRALKAATRESTVLVATHSAAVVEGADAVWSIESGTLHRLAEVAR